MKVYRENDVALDALTGKTIAILGYGIQGRAQAANFKDGGFDVVVGGRPGKSLEQARKDGFQTASFQDAAKKAHVLSMLVPDIVQSGVFEQIKPHAAGKTLVFAHGSPIHFGWVKPENNCDVVLVAPSGPGKKVRSGFLDETGVVATFAVHQDVSGSARQTVLSYAHAQGFTYAGVFESSFRDEAVCDLFGEQAILCGGVPELIRQSYDVLVKRGYSKEMAYLGTLYELRALTQMYVEKGLDGMLENVSSAAGYGGLMQGKEAVGPETKKRLEKVLDDVESGAFMNAFSNESKNDFPETKRLLEEEKEKDVNRTGARVRKQFKL
ncbi:ketol-acid reductoisomerase [Candidatus Micrarchaeota archaeon]|nr:ketol-acid reductoisomerase [Candidatus Micrarchaeota archaeon]